MNGAESLLNTLINNDVDVCFTNPGTSEMHFVAALDEVEGMRCVLCLFEGVVSGAAGGYAAMANKPASTLLHLGPGLGNAWANIHNAKKGRLPMVNIVGDQATYHLKYDAPLTSDIESVAGAVSSWVHTSAAPECIAKDTAEAVRQANVGQVATLMLPADVSWGDNPNGPEAGVSGLGPAAIPESRVDEALARLKSGKKCMVMIGGRDVSSARGIALRRIGKATGARVGADVFPTKIARGAGTAAPERTPYLAEKATDHLKDVEQLILIGAVAPVAFFAYPNLPSTILADDCEAFVLAAPDDDIDQALGDLMEKLGCSNEAVELQALDLPELPKGDLNIHATALTIAHLLPENAVVIDESITAGSLLYPLTKASRQHDWLNLTGGSIGWGLPAAVGAAIACPERKVVALEGDGSAMYTIQALWTMARENLDVTVVIFNNQSYNVLEMEFGRTGARGGKPGPNATSVLNIGNPDMDFVAMAEGMGVKATRATTSEAFIEQFEQAMKGKGPHLIDAMVPPLI